MVSGEKICQGLKHQSLIGNLPVGCLETWTKEHSLISWPLWDMGVVSQPSEMTGLGNGLKFDGMCIYDMYSLADCLTK